MGEISAFPILYACPALNYLVVKFLCAVYEKQHHVLRFSQWPFNNLW